MFTVNFYQGAVDMMEGGLLILPNLIIITVTILGRLMMEGLGH